MDVQLRRLRLSRELTELDTEQFLFLDGDFLLAEEDNPTLRH